MLAQRAGQGHQPVTECLRQLAFELRRPGQIGRGSGQGGRQRKTGHPRWKRQQRARIGPGLEAVGIRPVRRQYMTVAQISDAGAADLANFCKGPGHRVAAQHGIDPAANLFKRRAMVRRTEEDQMFESAQPLQATRSRAVAGAACHQPTHAVGQQAQRLHLYRPGFQQVLQQRRKLPAIDAGMQAGVVVQVNRGVTQLAR